MRLEPGITRRDKTSRGRAVVRSAAFGLMLLLAVAALGCDVSRQPAEGSSSDDGPAEVAVIESDIAVDLTTNGYAPESDLLIAMGGDDQHPRLHLISPEGEVTRSWEVTNRYGDTIGDRRILPNGNILFVIWYDGIYEMTPDGDLAWYMHDEHATHHAEPLPNGNLLVVGALCNCVREIDPATEEEVWYWDAHQVFPDYRDDDIFRGGEDWSIESLYADDYEDGESWSHSNHAQALENGNVLVSLRNFDTVLEVNRDGAAVWSYGPGIIKHQHTPRLLDDGTLLIFDNGNHRAVRIDRGSGEILWEYDDLDAAIMGDVSLLDDGHYKVVNSLQHEVKIVSEAGEVLWQARIDGDQIGSGIYRAHFPGLENGASAS